LIAGITKVRNLGSSIGYPLIRDTLDSWAAVCDEIWVYDDCSTDDTADICRDHPAVTEVVASNFLDPNRMRAEWRNRQTALSAAQRFGPSWVTYFDGDEHLHAFDTAMLEDDSISVIAARWHDAMITPEDADLPLDRYKERRWCAVEYRSIPFFFRNNPILSFNKPDQRIMDHATPGYYPVNGVVQHWGKGFSAEIWERKCEYYSDTFGHKGYAPKWEARKGKAIHADYKSDDGNPLQLWTEILDNYQPRVKGMDS